MKLIIKLAIVAVLANAGWRLATAYVTFYRFKDAVVEIAQFGVQQTSSDLHQRISALAIDSGLPLADDAFTVRRDSFNHTFVDGSYVQPVELFPGFRYPWPFSWHVDVLTLTAAPPDPLRGR